MYKAQKNPLISAGNQKCDPAARLLHLSQLRGVNLTAAGHGWRSDDVRTELVGRAAIIGIGCKWWAIKTSCEEGILAKFVPY